MKDRIGRRFGYAEVMGTLGVFLALAGGAAFAAEKIGSKEIAKNAIKSKHIKNGQVKAGDTGVGVLDTCARGSLAAAVQVDGSASFPSAYTSSGVSGFACRGSVQARRVAEGSYRVCLLGVETSAVGAATGSSLHQAANSAPGNDNFVTVRPLGADAGCDGAPIEARSNDASSNENDLELQDDDFTVVVSAR